MDSYQLTRRLEEIERGFSELLPAHVKGPGVSRTPKPVRMDEDLDRHWNQLVVEKRQLMAALIGGRTDA